MATGTAVHWKQSSSPRYRLRRKILSFSLVCATIGLLLGVAAFCIVGLYLPNKKLAKTNNETFARIHCDAESCDISGIANVWDFGASDYVLDKESRFFISVDSSAEWYSPLRYSDTEFLRKFEIPASVSTPAKESWRLYSIRRKVGDEHVIITVGYAERASWKMNLPIYPPNAIDPELKAQAERIAAALKMSDGHVVLPSSSTRKFSVDSYQIVDATNNSLLYGGNWLPMYFPGDKPFPNQGLSLHRDNADLYLVRTDTDINNRMLAVAISQEPVADIVSLAVLFLFCFLAPGVVAYIAGNTFLRKYLLFSDAHPISLEEARSRGENERVEFKRSLSFDTPKSVEQMLQTLTAFLNSGDGTLFIGIEDDLTVRGVPVQTPQEKDQFAQKIYHVARQKIRPSPSIRVDFPDSDGVAICRIFVPRGEEPLYYLDGTIYVRYGPTDIKAQPEIVIKLLAEYAF